MSTRLRRVEQQLQREIASVLVSGELRDPRLQKTAAISVTGVAVSPDLSTAKVFIDVLVGGASVASILEGLNAGAGAMRGKLRDRMRLKRTPSLRFFRDESIAEGANIERVLAEIHAAHPPEVTETADADAAEGPAAAPAADADDAAT
jgi:ribosome-binding factor A